MGMLEELGLRGKRDPFATKDPDLAHLREVRAELHAELDAIAKRYGYDVSDAKQRVTENTSPPHASTLHARRIVDLVAKESRLSVSRPVVAVNPTGTTAARVVKADPAPLRDRARVLHNGEPFTFAIVNENGTELEPVSVAAGLRSGRVVALVGWRSLGRSDVERELKAAAAIALERETIRSEFVKGN